MQFFTVQDSQFFPGLSIYDPGLWPFAAAGFAMSNYVFDYGLTEYRTRPTTFNMALMLFAATDFLLYTACANYIKPDDPWLVNQIWQETGFSKSELLDLAALNALCNAYRISHKSEKHEFQPVLSYIPTIALLLAF